MEARRKKHPSAHLPGRPATSPGRLRSPGDRPDVLATLSDHATIITSRDGRATHAVIPYDDYVRLIALQAAREGERILDDPATEWIDAEDAQAMIAANEIADARKSKGLSQSQLGKMLGLPQSQISRVERNPDASSLRLIKRIAKALGVRLVSVA